MDAIQKTLLLLIEAYELHPNENNAMALKQFLSKEILSGSVELKQALSEAKRLLSDWEYLDAQWHHLVQSFIG